jgi:hypothetical protein
MTSTDHITSNLDKLAVQNKGTNWTSQPAGQV